jgi:hypothetical protein
MILRLLCLYVLLMVPALAKDARFEADGVAVSEVVAWIYREVLRAPYVLSPEVYADRRLVAVRFQASEERAVTEARRYLTALGLTIRAQDGVDVLRYIEEEPRTWVYRPRYRDVSYLHGAIRQMLPGSVAGVSSMGAVPVPQGMEVDTSRAPPQSATALLDNRQESLVVNAPDRVVRAIQQVVRRLDVPQGQVDVKATVYEVTSGRTDGSALQLAQKVLTSRLGVQLDYAPSAAGGASVSFRGGDYTAIASVLSTDTAFKTVSTPYVRAKSGTTTEFNSGEQVPVLGNVSYAGASGQPVQSVEYKDSGVIFKVKPEVRPGVIDVEVQQELSSFTTTSTGVNNSPTLIKRSIKSSLAMHDGEVVLIGGLNQTRDGNTKRGIFSLPFENQDDNSRVEVILLLQVTAVPFAVEAPRPEARPPRDRHPRALVRKG